ncbi:protein EVI2B [Vidua macroura]|uniref:protein EVI2B n=1 Tax=Vidua macroura TaxID=187451 RepID=UPI0023A7CE87|nr:protein EVI2B [Vidua macroura]XP_053851910.1 protein EVI2B [Vidua macroura]
MASNQVMLVLFCGEIWSSLSAAAPHHAARTESHTCTTATSPGADRPPLYQLQATVPSWYQSDRPLAATEPQAFPGEEEAGDGSWVAALIIGSILIGMTLAIIIILLWKCCMRPPLAESHWAGRSPFVDGDTSDLFMDSDPGTKRSSVLFMLPWRLKPGTHLQEDPTVPENPPHATGSAESGQVAPAAAGCSGASTAPAPGSEAASPAAGSCPAPDTAPECPDLPAPPDWLREPAEEASSDPSKHSALHLEAEEPQPPPPELLIQESHETLPQPEHPL